MPTIQVYGELADVTSDEPTGYLHLTRTWWPETRIELDPPMAVQQLVTRLDVVDAAGKVTLRRGLLVYCVEGVDAPYPFSSESRLTSTRRLSTMLICWMTS